MRLTTKFSLRPDLECDSRDFSGEHPQADHHRVDRCLELEDLASGIDFNLFGEISASDGFGDLGDGPDLAGEVPGEVVHDVCELAPCALDVQYECLAAEFTTNTV